MTEYDTAQQAPAAAPRRRIGIKGPLTGLVLIALVTYGSWWGWQKAFGDAAPVTVTVTGCPTPSVSVPATGSAAATGAAVAGAAQAAAVARDAAARQAAAVVQVAVATPTTPAVTPTGPVYLAAVDVQVNVYNATSRPGLAANTAAVLRDRGFTVKTVDNAPADDLVPEVAQIRASVADSPQVRLLVQHVPSAVIVPDGRPDATVDLVLGDLFQSLGDPALVTPVPIPTATC